MGMHHSTSGKAGYRLSYVPGVPMMELEMVLRCWVEEDKLRKDPSIQARYGEEDSDEWREKVTREVQEEAVCRAHGWNKEEVLAESPETLQMTVGSLNNARFDYHRKIEAGVLDADLPVYIKYDYSHQGHLRAGHDYVDVPSLVSLSPQENGAFQGLGNSKECSLAALVEMAGDRPLVVLAGSQS